ncbi:hypothetical protein BC833DRAFT_602768, partial [Globomyces pollinis-pini]
MNHIEIVQLLLNDARIDPSANDNRAFEIAVEMGHIEIVKMLLHDLIDPSENGNRALEIATSMKHKEIAHLLLKDARVNSSVTVNRM